jgi:hypothetical protein
MASASRASYHEQHFPTIIGKQMKFLRTISCTVEKLHPRTRPGSDGVHTILCVTFTKVIVDGGLPGFSTEKLFSTRTNAQPPRKCYSKRCHPRAGKNLKRRILYREESSLRQA